MPDQTQVAQPRDSASQPGRVRARRLMLRPAFDLAVVFGALCAISLAFGAVPSSAGPTVTVDAMTLSPAVTKAIASDDVRPLVEIATTASSASPEAVFRRTSAQTAWMLLMVSLSLIVALNLALYRHLRRAYAPAKRRKS